jgi:hypothetical protein
MVTHYSPHVSDTYSVSLLSSQSKLGENYCFNFIYFSFIVNTILLVVIENSPILNLPLCLSKL